MVTAKSIYGNVRRRRLGDKLDYNHFQEENVISVSPDYSELISSKNSNRIVSIDNGEVTELVFPEVTCRFARSCEGYGPKDHFCNLGRGKAGVDLTKNCYRPMK